MNWYIYGLIASFFLGIYNFLYGLLNKNLGLSTVLIGIGTGVIFTGLVLNLGSKKHSFILSNFLFPVLIGVFLGLAIIFVVKSFSDPKANVAKLIPLINTNTLFSVLLGLIILKEYRTVSLIKVLVGTLLILMGAIIIR